MSKDLKTCPFCGGGCEVYKYPSWIDGMRCPNFDSFYVKCLSCKLNNLNQGHGTEEAAITAWNTRTPDVNADLLEGLKEAVYIVKQVNTIISTPDRYPTLSWRKLIKQAEGE